MIRTFYEHKIICPKCKKDLGIICHEFNNHQCPYCGHEEDREKFKKTIRFVYKGKFLDEV